MVRNKKTKQKNSWCPTPRFQTVVAGQTCEIWGRCIPPTSGRKGSSWTSPPGWSPHTWARRRFRPSGRWWPTPRWSASSGGPASGPYRTAGWAPATGSSPETPGWKTAQSRSNENINTDPMQRTSAVIWRWLAASWQVVHITRYILNVHLIYKRKMDPVIYY